MKVTVLLRVECYLLGTDTLQRRKGACAGDSTQTSRRVASVSGAADVALHRVASAESTAVRAGDVRC